MKRITLALFACAALASGQTNSEARAKKIIDEAIEALGGQKFLSMQDRLESGRAYSFFREQLSGLSVARIYTKYLSLPREKTGSELGIYERQAFGKNEDSYVLFRQEGAWEVTFRGAKPLEAERIARYRDTTLGNVFYILRMRLNEPGMVFEAKGLEVIENAPMEAVEITDSQNRVVTAYFHPTTKLPVRQSWVWRDPKTRERDEEVTRFSRYRAVNGVQWPHQIHRERNGEKIYEIFSEAVTINSAPADKLFSVPGPDTKAGR